jgi:Flp pilus assembly protein TadG
MNRFRSFSALTRRFGSNQAAASAIEFSLLLPFLMLVLAGTFDLDEALTVNRKMRQISSMVADLVAQRSTISASDVTTILAGASTVLAPYDTTNLKILLNVVNITSSAQTIAWSKAYQTTALTTNSTNTNAVPAAIAEAGIQMVAVSVNYSFSTLFSGYLEGLTGRTGYSMGDTIYERPRIGDTITLN